MLNKEEVKKLTYLDVETACIEKDLDSLKNKNPRLAESWSRRCKYYRSSHIGYQDYTDDQIFLEKASLEPEFSRIVCVSFGVFDDSDPNGKRLMSFFGPSELEILEKVNKILNNAMVQKRRLCGHNIKGFDIPCIGKRMLYNGIEPSQNIQVWGKKPWEMDFVDTAEVFSFGSWTHQKTLSLDLLTCTMGVESPKGSMDGSKVNEAYWDGQIDDISMYCERDVVAVMEVMEKIAFR